MTAHIRDDSSGNASEAFISGPSHARFSHQVGDPEDPNSYAQHVDAILSDDQRISGTANDGVVQYQMVVPRYSAQGTWSLEYVLLVDEMGNQRRITGSEAAAAGFLTTFQQTGAGDTTPPTLESFSLSPSSIDTSGSDQTITVTAGIKDNLSGVSAQSLSDATFTSPSEEQQVSAAFEEGDRVSGTATDGVYTHQMLVGQGSECGTWTARVHLIDAVGNLRTLRSSDLATAGFPASFENC